MSREAEKFLIRVCRINLPAISSRWASPTKVRQAKLGGGPNWGNNGVKIAQTLRLLLWEGGGGGELLVNDSIIIL